MRCYYVHMHGALAWHVAAPDDPDFYQPMGFYCHRYVFASDEGQAIRKAFAHVRQNLDRGGRWLSGGDATLKLEAEEVSVAPLLNLLRPRGGYSFYDVE